MDEKHVADYFIISGVPELAEHRVESKPLINSALPITDVTVIIKGAGEQCPIGYTCIEYTPGGHVADLNNGNFKSPNIHICYKRGNDKPPLIDVGVYHQGRDRVLPDVEIVQRTPYGRCASTGTNAGKAGTFVTFRRAKTNSPFNQLVVVDLCVILNNKSEHPPHAFFSIKKNLNKSYYGMIGSEVFLCYKKTLLSPPSLCFTPQIVSRFPLQDCATFPLPDTVPLFCLPAGASIELRPANVPLPRPTATTFVLTSDSAQKIYGSGLSFYEPYDATLLTQEQREKLGFNQTTTDSEKTEHNSIQQRTYALKSICILSKWPFFECFEKYLIFLHKLVFSPTYSPTNPESPTHSNNVPLEHHISHFLLDVAFPTPQRPTVMVQLIPGTDETLTISQPSSRLPLPLTGASFIQLLCTLGVDNTMNVLLFGLCEQKILLHSLHPSNLTGVAEAITAMLFPFHWQCPYVPLCPLSLHGILNAPLPFIVGIDSRCFDTFTPPDDVICIDLDTRSIHMSELKRCLNLRILPKRAARFLRGSLEKIFQNWIRISQAIGATNSPQHRNIQMEASKRQLAKRLELEIQEAFVIFMATILRGFRSYLLPITSAPTVGATDPTSLFNFEGFLMSRDRSYSQFYQLITRTQMFTHYIEERSFVSDKDTSLAFFDDCEEKVSAADDSFPGKPIKLFDKDDGIIPTDRSVYIPAPEQSPSVSHSNSMNDSQEQQSQAQDKKLRFGPLNSALFHRHPSKNIYPSLDKAPTSTSFENHMLFESVSNELNATFSISRRTKQEVKASQRMARKSADRPLDWSKYLVSCCYCLWFSTLPSYIAYCKSINQEEQTTDEAGVNKSTARILRYAHSTIARMQKLELTTDEVCFRILTLLCGHYGQPALAVRVFFEMKKAGIKPNAVTYGYYNKAVLESRWPDHSTKPTMVLWTKIRNVISGIALFKLHGRLRLERRQKLSIHMIGGDMSFGHVDVTDLATTSENCETNLSLFPPTTLPIRKDKSKNDDGSSYKGFSKHRRSLFNRSYSTHQKGTDEEPGHANEFDLLGLRDEHKSVIHKSYSMHLRNGSPEKSSSLCIRSHSSEDEDERPIVAQKLLDNQTETLPTRKIASTHDMFLSLKEKHQLLTTLDSDHDLIGNVDLIENQAGLLFTTDPETCRKVSRSASQSPIQTNFTATTQNGSTTATNSQPDSLFPDLSAQNPSSAENELLNASCFGEDAQILRKIESREQKPNFTDSVDFLHNHDDVSSEGTRSNKLSESITDFSTGNPSNEDNFSLSNISATPNFKIASLINDASNLQWSRWTSSQNSKSVYKGIKSAATGIVSSLQEIKSSFSISNNATPAKMISTAQHKSNTTREMLSQWATQFGYFSTQTHQSGYDDSDGESIASNDLFRLSNDEDAEQSISDVNDFRLCQGLFSALEKHYNNSNSREDLVNHFSEEDDVDVSQVAIKISLTTCSRCNVCHSLLYDEEIMERWSHNESNLNTRCIYCRAKIVPLMSIQVEDRRFPSGSEEGLSGAFPTDVTDDLVNLNFEDEKLVDQPVEGNFIGGDVIKKQSASEAEKQNRPQTGWCRRDFTVPYLSPIVLRKELESVFESSGDNCPSSSRFIDEHPIIFWNLLWYFTRINIPTHLALLCLASKTILNGKEVPEEFKALDKVIVKTLWDNDKLHTGIGKPLYQLLERGDPSTQVLSILCDDIHFTRNFLDQVINLIKSNELQKAMNLVLNARLKGSTKFSFDRNRHNLYRDLIFLINTTLGPGKLHMDNFEREYKKAFENLNFQQVALNRFDRPPTARSLFCRKCFKEPGLIKRSG